MNQPRDNVRLVTHWTRVFYVDPFKRRAAMPAGDAERDARSRAAMPAIVHPRRVPARTKSAGNADDAGWQWLRSPLRTAAALLGLYLAMYLTVAAALRIVTLPHAAAAVLRDGSVLAAPIPAPSIFLPHVDEIRSSDRADNPPEGHRDAPTD